MALSPVTFKDERRHVSAAMFFFALFLILVLCVNMLDVQTVHAQGELPREPSVAAESTPIVPESTAEPESTSRE